MRTRWSLDPLANHLQVTRHRIGGHQPGDLPDGLALVAEVLGISHRTARRWQQLGVPDAAADAAACAVGLHPATAWPEWAVDTSRPEGDDGWFADDPELFADEPYIEQAA